MRLKQGDIIKLDFNPVKGNEQAGFRPAVVVSGNTFNRISSNVLVCPITNTDNGFPMHVPLGGCTSTTGFIMCDQVRTISPVARQVRYVEDLPEEVLAVVLDIIKGIFED